MLSYKRIENFRKIYEGIQNLTDVYMKSMLAQILHPKFFNIGFILFWIWPLLLDWFGHPDFYERFFFV